MKVSQDGVLLAWAAGAVGRDMPNTSPASENVAALAAATLSPTITQARSDYKGLEGLQDRDLHAISNRRSPYAGVHKLIRGKAPSGFSVTKVPGHIRPEDCVTDADRLNAIGNDMADRTAKAMAHSPASAGARGDRRVEQAASLSKEVFTVHTSSFVPVARKHPLAGPHHFPRGRTQSSPPACPSSRIS